MFTGYERIEVRPVAGALGAEIGGLDLARPLDERALAELRRAFAEHLVIFFRDQTITPAQQIAFARRFGELHVHPFTEGMRDHPEIIEIVKEPEERRNWGDNWHTDLTSLPEPPLGSILYAKETPPYSGDTLFSNMYLAYETLSAGMRAMIDPLVCVHRGGHEGYMNFQGMAHKDAPAVESEHPLARTHPVTGKKALFLHRKLIKHFKDMTAAESKPVLDFLFQHAENLDFTCRFRWRPGSIAFWDNRCTQHRVLADYFYDQRGFEPSRRRLHRVTIVGDRPV